MGPVSTIPNDNDHLAVSNANWSAKPKAKEMFQVVQLLKILKGMKVDGVNVTINFIYYQIQPCKETVTPTYKYAREDDINQEVPENIDRGRIYAWAIDFFKSGTLLSNKGQQKPYNVTNLPLSVRSNFADQCYSCFTMC